MWKEEIIACFRCMSFVQSKFDWLWISRGAYFFVFLLMGGLGLKGAIMLCVMTTCMGQYKGTGGVQCGEMQDEWIGLGVNAVKLPGS